MPEIPNEREEASMRHRGPVAPIMKRHPLTGEPIEPVGFVNGRPIFPISGGAPDEDDDDDKGGDDGDSGADDDNQDDGTDSGGDDDKVDRADLQKLMKRLQAADRRATEAERKLQEINDGKKDDLTKATDELTTVKADLEKAQSTISQLRLENSFLTTNKHTWHDGETALALANSKGYLEDVVNEDGSVDKVLLGKSLDRLAKEHPYLVKTDDKKKDDPPPSGEPAGGRSDNGKDDKARQDRLKRRFPSIAR